MKKLNVAIIGQGRSGKNIHGKFFRSEANTLYNVKYVVDFDELRRELAKDLYPGCEVFSDYKELFDKTDIDLVLNASFSYMHYPITKDLLSHGKNVLVEKPFARNRYECEDLIKTAKEHGVLLAVFQQTFFAPFYPFAKELVESGKLGKVEQINIAYNGFARRWDWQTLQKMMGGGIYNTGPHPIGLALGFLDFDKDYKVAYSRLASSITSGDADDYAKILLTAPGKPLVDLEVSSISGMTDYNIMIQGSKGCFKCTPKKYEMKYIVDGENPEHPVIEEFLKDEEGNPMYCTEKLNWHTEEGTFPGTAFDVGTQKLYEDVYAALTTGKELIIGPKHAMEVISVIEKVHADNPLPVKF